MRAAYEKQLTDAVATARQRSAAISQTTLQLANLEVTATSRNREVQVTVNANGKLLHVKIDPNHLPTEMEGITEQAAKEISKLLTQAGQAAQDAAKHEVRRRLTANANQRSP